VRAVRLDRAHERARCTKPCSRSCTAGEVDGEEPEHDDDDQARVRRMRPLQISDSGVSGNPCTPSPLRSVLQHVWEVPECRLRSRPNVVPISVPGVAVVGWWSHFGGQVVRFV